MLLNNISRLLTFKTSYKFLTCAGLVLVADFLFYGHNTTGHETGWALGIFATLLFLASSVHNVSPVRHRYYNIIFCVVGGTSFALMENHSILALSMCFVSMVGFVVLSKLPVIDDTRLLLTKILGYTVTGWWRLNRDALIFAHIRKLRQKVRKSKTVWFTYLALPFGLSAIFITLFAQANPVIAGWLSAIDLRNLFDGPAFFNAIARILYWIFIASTCWAVIRPKFKRKIIRVQALNSEFTLLSLFFSERSILLSLIMFNGLFIIQNILDILFIWSGTALPQGMTHAQYAHAGAYPLVATALLAAWFVLIALKPGSTTENNTTIRILVYSWVGQNVFLVTSSIMRLLGYVEEYSLTYLRVAAFIWMGLVALGLLLIVARIYFSKSSLWLVNTNAIALYATLYLCCFVNFGNIIAMYNVMHCWEIKITGTHMDPNQVHLDLNYLKNEVGVEAIPALIWFEQHHPFYSEAEAHTVREQLQDELHSTMNNWRLWTFRNLRLDASISPNSPEGK